MYPEQFKLNMVPDADEAEKSSIKILCDGEGNIYKGQVISPGTPIVSINDQIIFTLTKTSLMQRAEDIHVQVMTVETAQAGHNWESQMFGPIFSYQALLDNFE